MSRTRITLHNHMKEIVKKIGIYGHLKVYRDKFKSYLPNERLQHKKMLEFYRQFIKPDDIVFDVGANIGNRTDIFLELGATVVAIEPQPICLQQLNIKYKNNPKVKIVPKGLGANTEEHSLHLSNADTISTMSDDWLQSVKETGRFKGATWNQTILVQMTTLDELIGEFGSPSFCKIDVEGFELEVIKGLSQAIPNISFEYASESHTNAISILEKIDSLSQYMFNFSIGESMRFYHTDWLDKVTFIEYLEKTNTPTNFGDIYCKEV